MVRAAATFASEGVQPVPIYAPFRPNGGRYLEPWTPTGQALKVAEFAIYDYLGLFYYWSRGWMRSIPSANSGA